MNHRIMYLRDRKGQPVGCVAIKVFRDTDDLYHNLIVYQVSVLNPLDRFDRAMARQLALGRMVEAPLTCHAPVEPSMWETTQSVMRDIARDSGQPTRARQAAKLWLRNNEPQTQTFGLFDY